MKRALMTGVILVLLGVLPALAAVQQAPAAAPQGNEFVPVNSVPAAEQLPAAPMVLGAYAFVWVALLAYVFYVWRRMTKLETELADIKRQIHSK